jgi:hypothetical protein
MMTMMTIIPMLVPQTTGTRYPVEERARARMLPLWEYSSKEVWMMLTRVNLK